MDLECAQRLAFKNVSETQLRQAFADDAGRGEYIILSRSESVYIQAHGEGGGPYSVEYRDGDASRHFTAEGEFNREQVEALFLAYLRGEERWKTQVVWIPPAPRPWWKFW